jgi:hypothetical protein
MPALRELQAAFAAAVFDPVDTRVLGWVTEGDMSAPERFAVYRRNVFHNYREALRDVYPVCQRLVGEAFFEFAADAYIRRHRSIEGNLHAFGDRYADFLAGFAPAAGLAYLPDVARLEWAVHESFHAADHELLDLSRLAELPADQLPRVVFLLHPACRLVESAYPIHAVWQANQPGGEGRADLDAGGVRLLVRRPCNAVQLEPTEGAEHAMLRAFAAGQPLAAAVGAARANDGGFDLGGFLARRVGDATVAGFRCPLL